MRLEYAAEGTAYPQTCFWGNINLSSINPFAIGIIS